MIQQSKIVAYLNICLIFILTTSAVNAQISANILTKEKYTESSVNTKINDGPYVFIEENNLIEKKIIDGEVTTKKIPLNSYKTTFTPEASVYKKAVKIAAISDFHGQYNLAISILKNNKIIDDHLNWIFGNGHLVIVGDIFDRGDKVTELLWFIYHLEKQAEKSNGKVHYLLGNHEYMVLQNDIRYISDKYQTASKLLNINYSELFSNNTVLGRWLRSKATIVKINNNTFVHGGISKEFIASGYDIDDINNLMSASIDKSKEEMKTTSFYKKYYGNNGPIWYRGYFNDHLKDVTIQEILKQIKSKHIVVGHCSNEHVVELYDKKVFGVDSSIKNGEYGEILLINKNNYARGTLEGTVIEFK